MNADLLEKKYYILRCIREFFTGAGFTEVDTPLLSSSPGIEPYLEPFRTYCITPQKKNKLCYFPYSPEFFMKRLLADGFTKIFQIAHCFRNEELSDYHLPEFLMLEWYRTYADYHDLMKDTESLCALICAKLNNFQIQMHKKAIDLSPPWNQITVKTLFQKHLDINLDECKDTALFYEKLKAARLQINSSMKHDWNALFFSAFLNGIEPHLESNKPLFILDYPTCVSALAKEKTDDNFYAERFELYINKIEIANGCSELQDYNSHKRRLSACNKERIKSHKKPYPQDKEFFSAIKKGLPVSAGVALGVDRLIMLLTGLSSLTASST